MGFDKTRRPRFRKQEALDRGIDEGVSDRLPVSAIGHRREHAIVRQSRLGGVAGDLRGDGVRLGDAVEAAQTRDLLDQILLDAHIEAMRGTQHAPAQLRRLDALADRPQDPADLRIRNARSQQPRETAAPQPHPLLGLGLRLGPRHLHGTGLAARNLQEQRRRALEGDRRQSGIHAPLEALAAIGQ
jgi:hypothetical protein